MIQKTWSPEMNLQPEGNHSLPGKQQRILVVDDDASLRRLNRAALMKNGYVVDTASDGQAGWERIQTSPYDLVITDFNMPRMTGWQLIEKIHVNNLKLPVILVTADYPQTLLNQQPGMQIEAMLLKPYNLEELLTVVGNVLYCSEQGSPDFKLPPRRQTLPPLQHFP